MGDPVCGEIFGSPTYNDCEELATELSGGWPGEEPRPDRRLHLFTVPDAVIPSWVSPHPRNRRVILPQFASEGTTRSLILTFYAPDSSFDDSIQQWLKSGPALCKGTAGTEYGAAGASKNTQQETCAEDDDDFQKFLDDIGDFSTLEEPRAPVVPAPPLCGDSCWGPVNLCGASDGCRCIADSFQGVGSRYYTGTCKPSNFAFDGRRLRETLVNGTDLVHVTSNFSLAFNGSANFQGFYSYDPPSEPFRFHVQDSDVNVTFFDYELYPTRNESVVSSCITAAIQDTIPREYFQPIGLHDLTYLRDFVDDSHYHKNVLAISPENGMTWGSWTTALIGIDWFVERYNGWDFMFEVLSVDEMDGRSLVQLLGEGHLWTLDELPPFKPLA
ncbi:MAG: hypothetical protein ASARMPRED_000002 [Alectoria sarmentosa]|nr:MAG: hypothetical protein ASARMPRED_000002 [Alectoria sarmentosa]